MPIALQRVRDMGGRQLRGHFGDRLERKAFFVIALAIIILMQNDTDSGGKFRKSVMKRRAYYVESNSSYGKTVERKAR